MGSLQEARDEEDVEDMIDLSDLNDQSILRNLKIRYAKELFYTYTGSILVAVNPYKMFKIYGLDMVKRYEGQALGTLPPHLFAIGSASYSKMIKDKENQVLVISGESGAGKTESTKLIMQYLAAVNKSGNNLITEQILEANPLLESFGNAKTIRNDNSSRFGKYIEVHFKSGSIVGARLSEYLLEKSRIVTQAPEERNYHVFYEMLESLTDEQKSKYGLQTAPRYFYLNQGGSSLIPGRDDADNFRKLTAAMDILNFERQEQETVIKILASVLHIGNIFFQAIPQNNHDTVGLGSDAEIKWISYLLELSDDWLKQALISKVTEARGDRVVSPYNLEQALDARDAMAKSLYCRMFSWLVERVNLIICRAEREKSTSLAVLDIFGFEDFRLNSFEQLCINYANETLQYFFNQHIFQLEQKEYIKEKIRWEHIEFKDNQPTIDLIATKPSGILHILDDECNFPQSTDKSFLEKCHFQHSGNSLYDKPRMSDPEFFIAHYAGKIRYNVQHFLEKNKDTLRSDVIELMCESKNKLIAQMFKDHRDKMITKTLSKTTGHFITKKPRAPTVAAGFNESLLSLIDTMTRCNPYFVRCIKPNASKRPMVFEDVVVSDQLRYTGMLETIRIRKMGYPVRIKLPHFIDRYRCLLRDQAIKPGQVPWDVCNLILKTQGPEHKDMYQIGATKVFMKETFEQKLYADAMKIQRAAATRIQTHVRMFLARQRHLRMRKSAERIQRMVRMWRARRQFRSMRNGIILAQAQYRMFSQRRSYLHNRHEIRHRLEEDTVIFRKQEAQHRLESEHRERQAQIMAGVANLDVPGELALVISRLDDWELRHNGQHIITAAGDVIPLDMGYKLPVDINSYLFSKYVSVYFRNPNWGVHLEPLRTSITVLQGEEQVSRALAVFKLILRFMCDTLMDEKREKILSDFIVLMGLKYEGIRDEILCQIVNQIWKNQNVERLERIWRLLANCLCCFNPSPSLFKYLLKFVSDVGQNGFNQICQHKILQSAYMDPLLSRVYPPTFLEWKAIQRKASMGLEVKYPDGKNTIGHVESWTSGELFASHLMKLRGLTDNCQGWTLQLQEDTDYYELMGYDYVLDLVSEVEVAPDFPANTAYFLVSVDRSREKIHHRVHHHTWGPHNAEKERILQLSGPLPQMLKRSTPTVTASSQTDQQQTLSSSRRPHKVLNAEDELGFSRTSVLNQRPTEILPAGLSENSKMNLRYTKRSRAPSGPGVNGGLSNGFTTDEDDDDEFLSDLSRHKFNTRYFPNGDINIDTKDLSENKINHRYHKKSRQSRISAAGVSGQLSRKGVSRDVNSDNTDWSHLVEDIFNNALDEHDEQNGRLLGSRIKGGGKGIPGLQTQPLTQPLGLNYGLINPMMGVGQPVIPTMAAPPVLPTLGMISTDPLQQITAQQLAQQQAVLQAYLAQQQQQQAQQNVFAQQQAQAYLAQQQAQAQQQQQQALLAQQQQQQALLAQQQQQQALLSQQQQQQALLSQQQQSATALKAALQEQELQNKFLKQSIEQENLKNQLRQMQAFQVAPVVPSATTVPVVVPAVPVIQPVSVANHFSAMAVSPSSSFTSSSSHTTMATSSVGVRGNKVTATSFQPPSPPQPQALSPAASSSTLIFENGTGNSQGAVQKKVSFMNSNYEDQVDFGQTLSPPPTASKVPPPTAPKQPRTQFQFQQTPSSGTTRTITVKSTSTIDVPAAPPSPPPAPPTNYPDVPPLHTQPVVPPAPPPPPPSLPSGIQIDKDRGTFTIRDRSGRARTVRIGRVVWPPPIEKQEKHDIQVGKLEIDEHVATSIEGKVSGNKKWKKQEPIIKSPDPIPKSILKTGEGQNKKRTVSAIELSHHETLKYLEQKIGASPSTLANKPALTEAPPKPHKTYITEGTETEGNVYATTIVKDELKPPPVPASAPPKVTKTITTETIEITELQRSSGEYARRIVPESTYARRIEPADPVPAVKALPPPAPVEKEPASANIDYTAFERVITELYPQNKKFFLMYNKVPWTLHIRKEVFWPSEKLENPLALHLIYCQIVSDVFNAACIRINKDQRIKMKGMLEAHDINPQNYLTKELKPQVKKVIVDTAKEWPTYFCRLFPIAGSGHYSGVRYLGVSHTGLRLITRDRTFVDDHLSVIEEIRFEDVMDVVLPTTSTVQLNLRTKSLIFETTRAQQMKDMVDRFCRESEKGHNYVVALKDYITRESTLLSFKRGDIIKLMEPEMNLESGWMYGSLSGTVGLFPAEYVKPLARHEVETSSVTPVLYQSKLNTETTTGDMVNGYNVRDSRSPDDNSETSQGTVVADGKYSMLDFAKTHFRESSDRKSLQTDRHYGISNGNLKADRSWLEQTDIVKWTRSPIQASLLRLNSPDLNKLALECFIAIMRFMGDYPMAPDMTDYDCAKKILKACHKYPEIRDEVFCQLCKQTTSNRSMFSKSKIRGWRLFGLVAAYFDCSDSLRPYLFKYLETAAADSNRTYNDAASLCLTNLRKTFKYGGRKDVPLREEVVALADGRNSKRFPFFYSVGDTHEGILNVKSCTVAQDCIEEVCSGLNILDPVEMEEYTLFIRTRDGTFSKLNREDYLLDETAFYIRKQIQYDLIFQRTVWYFPLKHLDNEIYVDMMFHQCVLDYIEGFLVMLPGNRLLKDTAADVAYLGAILHKANKMVGIPTLKDLESLLPGNVRLLPEMKPQQWLNKIQENLEASSVSRLTRLEAKVQFVEFLKKWTLFGSTFFLIKNIPNVAGEALLAVNNKGISFLRRNSNEVLIEHPFSEILSTRRYHGENNVNYLDMKLGNLMVQQILRIETDQGSDISDLIGQYMQVINRNRKRQDKPNSNIR